MANAIFSYSYSNLSSSSLLTITLPSPSSSLSSTSLHPFNRNPFQKNSHLYASPTIRFISSKQLRPSFKINAAASADTTEQKQPKWWEKKAGPNMIDIHSTQEFLNSLSLAGEKLVIVEFYGTWCASCRALFPKLCRTAVEHPEVLFLKVNFDENKSMCKSLNVKVLPYFHFYRGADGQLESFSCSLAKFQKVKDAIQMHNTDRCSIGPTRGIGELLAMELNKD